MRIFLSRAVFRILVLSFALLVYSQAKAGLILQADYFMLSDDLSITSSNSTSTSSSFYDAGIMFTIDAKKSFGIGWSAIGIGNDQKVNSTTVNFASSDMGPVAKWSFGKDSNYAVLLTYGLICKGTYKVTGSSSENWDGSSLFGQFAYQPKIGDTLRIAFSLNYYSASYTTKLVGTTQTNISYSKTFMFPMIGLTYQW